MARIRSKKPLVSFHRQQRTESQYPTVTRTGESPQPEHSSQDPSSRERIKGNISNWFNQKFRGSSSSLTSHERNDETGKNVYVGPTTQAEVERLHRTEQVVGMSTKTKRVESVGKDEREVGRPTVSKALEDAQSSVQQLHNASATAVTYTNIVGNASTALDQIDAFNATYLQPLKVFNAFVNTIANVHPYAKMALGVLSWASQMIITQVNRDASIAILVVKISEFYKFITEDGRLSELLSMQVVVKSMADQILDCARFIKNYSETKSFWTRLGKNVIAETDAIIAKYNTALDGLMQSFRDQAVRDTHVVVHQIFEDLEQIGDSMELSGMAYAASAGLNTSKKCLEGTRTEILDEIVEWINLHDADAPRVFWLSGQAGKGKSAIAHTVAAWADGLGVLGSCFCFARDRQAERRHEKMFTTIARDLAGRDPFLRRALAGAISADPSLKSTADIERQWRRLVLEPLSKVSADTLRTMVVVIDALDESGNDVSREDILRVLTSMELDHLPNLRIFLTSRPLYDICDAFHGVIYIKARSLDDIDPTSIEGDIRLYIKDRLQAIRSPFDDAEVSQLATTSDGLFEWARLACEFIKPRQAGVNARKRFDELISRTCGKGSALLDDMYRNILSEIVHDSQDARVQFRSVMRQILYTVEPFSIGSLNAIRQHFQSDKEPADVEEILEFMAALLSGTTDQTNPVRPLHASFYDFLTDPMRSGTFHVDKAEAELNLALASIRVMRKGLKFNICGLESSYLRNSNVGNLEERVKACIPPHLSYACKFWANHMQKKTFDASLAVELTAFCGSEHILFWFEVLSLLKSLGTSLTSLEELEKWAQGETGYKNLCATASDGVKFIQTFGAAISTSTPHLYLSALPFSPAKSVMTTQFIHRFSNLLQVVSGQQQEWSTHQVLRGHASSVTSVAFSPDGKRIVSGSWDHTVCLWDVHSGAQIGSALKGHPGEVNSVAFSPDGKWVASGLQDNTICVWDAHNGYQIKCIEGHTGSVHSVAFSPDGKWIVSGSGDRTVCLWDAHHGSLIGSSFSGHTDVVWSAAFSPDGKWIVSGSEDKTLCLWDACTGSQIGNPFEGHTKGVKSVAFSPDGKQIVSGSDDKTICFWNVHAGSQICEALEGHTYAVYSVAFCPTGRWIVSGSVDSTICVWNVESGSQIHCIKNHTNTIYSVSFSPDGQWIASGSADNTVSLWNANSTFSQINSPVEEEIGEISSVSFSPDGKWIVSGSFNGLIYLWDAKSGFQIGEPFKGHTDEVRSVAFSPDSGCIVSGSQDATACLWDTQTKSQIYIFHGHTGAVLSTAFSPDGKWIASGSVDNTVNLWDASDGSQIYILAGHTDSVRSVAFSPDGDWIVSGSDDWTLCLWDAHTGSQIESIKGQIDCIWSVAFSPDSRYIVSGLEDGTICLLDDHTRISIHQHTQTVFAVSCFGGRMVTGSRDVTIRLWDVHTRSQIALFHGHTGSIMSVAFSPDGSQVVSGSMDSTIRVWDVNHSAEYPVTPSICFSSTKEHALCNAEGLFDGMEFDFSNQDYRDLVRLNHDGWIVGPSGQFLFWIPASLHPRLYSPRNTLVIPKGGPELDLSKMVHGDMWQECYLER